MGTIVITEAGVICAHGVSERNVLLMAHYVRGLYGDLMKGAGELGVTGQSNGGGVTGQSNGGGESHQDGGGALGASSDYDVQP